MLPLSEKEKRILVQSIRMALREGGYLYDDDFDDEELAALLCKLGANEGEIEDMVKYGW